MYDAAQPLVSALATVLATVLEDAPAAKDVKAGWLAFGVFIALCLAVAVLGWSLTKQLRKAQAAKDAGVYGDQPRTDEDD